MLFQNCFKIAVVALAALVGASCANIVSPTGGAKDTTPPHLISAKSTPNFQTHFKKQRIELTFDEYLKTLEDVFNQVVVSPPLNERPEVTLHGKTIRFEFPKDDTLRENATYTINFGAAVKDLNEGNVVPNLRFVFSTGATIDSLVVRGQVVDALTNLPVEGALLMLYDNFADSVVRKTKPFYFAKTDKSGNATIENVRAGTFKVFALLDKDQNYLFNQDIEKIGFSEKNLVVNGDFTAAKTDTSTIKLDISKEKRDTSKGKLLKTKVENKNPSPNAPLSIKLFDPPKKPRLMSKETEKYGVAKLIFNDEPKTASVRFDSIGQRTATEISKDTLLIWYDLPTGDGAWNVYSRASDTSRTTDTTRIRTRGRVDFFKKAKLNAALPQLNFAQHPSKPIVVPFNFPISRFDTSKIVLLDSAKKKIHLSIRRDSTSPRKLVFDAAWRENVKYEMLILPTALVDIYGLQNDSILLKINVQSKSEYGAIVLKINGLDSTKSYVAQVVNEGGIVANEFFIDNKKAFETRIETIVIDQYTIKVIEDLNRNRRWDSGDYDAHRQPERIFLKPVEGLRADWEVEPTLDISDY